MKLKNDTTRSTIRIIFHPFIDAKYTKNQLFSNISAKKFGGLTKTPYICNRKYNKYA